MATAILCCDFQPDVLGFLDPATKTNVVAKAKQALEAARSNSIFTVFIRSAFRPGYPEVSPNNQVDKSHIVSSTFLTGSKAFAAYKGANIAIDGTPGAQVTDELKPRDNEIVLTKLRIGSFSTTPLRTILTSQGVNHIVVFGVATSGVVLTTVREAADMDFKITVVSDACADRFVDAHKVLLETIFPRQATVVTTDQWIQSLQTTSH